MEGEVKEEKEGILDVKLILNGGKKINIEDAKYVSGRLGREKFIL